MNFTIEKLGESEIIALKMVEKAVDLPKEFLRRLQRTSRTGISQDYFNNMNSIWGNINAISQLGECDPDIANISKKRIFNLLRSFKTYEEYLLEKMEEYNLSNEPKLEKEEVFKKLIEEVPNAKILETKLLELRELGSRITDFSQVTEIAKILVIIRNFIYGSAIRDKSENDELLRDAEVVSRIKE